MKRYAIPAILLLTGCTGVDTSTPVYFSPHPLEYVEVRVIAYDDIDALNAEYRRGGGTDRIPAFSRWKGNQCEIHVMRVNRYNWHQESYWRGHEFIHCTDGAWHEE